MSVKDHLKDIWKIYLSYMKFGGTIAWLTLSGIMIYGLIAVPWNQWDIQDYVGLGIYLAPGVIFCIWKLALAGNILEDLKRLFGPRCQNPYVNQESFREISRYFRETFLDLFFCIFLIVIVPILFPILFVIIRLLWLTEPKENPQP